jgi:hypothetical protein
VTFDPATYLGLVGKERWVVAGLVALHLAVCATGLLVSQNRLSGRWDGATVATDLASSLEKLGGMDQATAKCDPVGLSNPTVDVAQSGISLPADVRAGG